MITQDELKEILEYDPDTGFFKWKKNINRNIKKGDLAGSYYGNTHIQIQVNKKKYLAHRLAWLYVYGEWPKNQIDHKNRIRSDNRISNLRDVSNSVNNSNRKTKSGKYRHVYWRKDISKWAVIITIDNNRFFKGFYENQKMAICVARYWRKKFQKKKF